MKSLKEKIFFVGMYLTIIAITMVCFWRVEEINNRPMLVENEIIVMNEK